MEGKPFKLDKHDIASAPRKQDRMSIYPHAKLTLNLQVFIHHTLQEECHNKEECIKTVK